MATESGEVDRYERLFANLARTRELLNGLDEEHWEEWMEKAERDIRARDAHGLEHLLRAYGGMESFSDLLIIPENGYQLGHDEARLVDTELRALRHALYLDASELLHELRRPS